MVCEHQLCAWARACHELFVIICVLLLKKNVQLVTSPGLSDCFGDRHNTVQLTVRPSAMLLQPGMFVRGSITGGAPLEEEEERRSLCFHQLVTHSIFAPSHLIELLSCTSVVLRRKHVLTLLAYVFIRYVRSKLPDEDPGKLGQNIVFPS